MKLFDSIEIENLLSFKQLKLELRPLNVLIGANASGKSNLLRVFNLLRSLPMRGGLAQTMADQGGANGWFHRGLNGPATIRGLGSNRVPLNYSIHLLKWGTTWEIQGEGFPEQMEGETLLYMLKEPAEKHPGLTAERRESWLSKIRLPGTKLWSLQEAFENIALYREFKTGPRTQAREGIFATASSLALAEDGSNLARILNRFQHTTAIDRIPELLSRLFQPFEKVYASSADGGVTQVYIKETGLDAPLSAASLSDGTLRFLCLLVVLLDPNPPPLICIEEPEVGLHPDAIRLLTELLIEASTRTQLIVTTHSPALIDALSSDPESVVVAERDSEGNTTMKRLNTSDLDLWLERYSLGELWVKGEIGGNRW